MILVAAPANDSDMLLSIMQRALWNCSFACFTGSKETQSSAQGQAYFKWQPAQGQAYFKWQPCSA